MEACERRVGSILECAARQLGALQEAVLERDASLAELSAEYEILERERGEGAEEAVGAQDETSGGGADGAIDGYGSACAFDGSMGPRDSSVASRIGSVQATPSPLRRSQRTDDALTTTELLRLQSEVDTCVSLIDQALGSGFQTLELQQPKVESPSPVSPDMETAKEGQGTADSPTESFSHSRQALPPLSLSRQGTQSSLMSFSMARSLSRQGSFVQRTHGSKGGVGGRLQSRLTELLAHAGATERELAEAGTWVSGALRKVAARIGDDDGVAVRARLLSDIVEVLASSSEGRRLLDAERAVRELNAEMQDVRAKLSAAERMHAEQKHRSDELEATHKSTYAALVDAEEEATRTLPPQPRPSTCPPACHAHASTRHGRVCV
jgi:hypothetical protein